MLENSAQAVLGVKEGGAEAMRLDSVAVPETTTLEAYVRSGWIDGLLDSSIEKINVGGMPAVTATARAGEWNFRLAVIRFDDDEVYRIIFATHGHDPAHETAFRAAIDSFRKIGPDEADKVKPLRIGLETAKPGESAATMSQKMVVADKPLETFELLNGLEDAAAPTAGERYKVVEE